MTSEPVATLPRKTDYGPFVRIVAPGRHVYRTTMDFRRWFIGILSLGAAGVFGWMAHDAFVNDKVLFDSALFAALDHAFLTAVTLICVMAAILAFVYAIRLTITTRHISLYRRGFWVGRRTWLLSDLVRVRTDVMLSFNIGRASAIYGIELDLLGGAVEKLHMSFENSASAERFARDLTESVRLMASEKGLQP